jgi:hypothetical protein
MMTKVIPFVTVTKQSILREGKRELLRLYQISAGGTDPVVDTRSWEDFEAGHIDEMPFVDFASLTYQMYLEDKKNEES